jgi:hypothetical protein
VKTSRSRQPATGSEVPRPVAGVTRIDLVCGPRIEQTAEALARRWAQDRGLRNRAVERLGTLALTATEHGLRFDPRGLTMSIRWLDLDRICLEVRWHGCSRGAHPSARRPSLPQGKIARTAAILDGLAADWGFRGGTEAPVHWMVLETS